MNAFDTFDHEAPDLAREVLADERLARIVEHPDGYYWSSADVHAQFGPFASVEEALADMEAEEGSEPEIDALAEAEQELGISDWIDPDTGAPAEGLSVRIEDH
jgi:hypothetical protein